MMIRSASSAAPWPELSRPTSILCPARHRRWPRWDQPPHPTTPTVAGPAASDRPVDIVSTPTRALAAPRRTVGDASGWPSLRTPHLCYSSLNDRPEMKQGLCSGGGTILRYASCRAAQVLMEPHLNSPAVCHGGGFSVLTEQRRPEAD
jgi:hypothetical protein